MHGQHLYGGGADVDVGRPGVAGQHLDLRRVGLAGRQPALAHLGRLQPGQERREGRQIGAGREPGGHLGQRVQVRPRPGSAIAGPGGHLDVEQQGPLDLDDELGEGQRRSRAQSAQQVAEPGQPVAAGGRQPQTGGVLPVLPRQRVERLDDAGLVDDIALHLAGVALRLPLAGVALRRAGSAAQRPSALRSRAPSRHIGPVSSRISASPRSGSAMTCRAADDVDDLGRAQQAAQTHDLDREPGRPQGGLDRDELGPGAAQDRSRGRPPLRRPTGRSPRPPRHG